MLFAIHIKEFQVMFLEENLEMFLDENFTPDQWETVNLELTRQLTPCPIMWEPLQEFHSFNSSADEVEDSPFSQATSDDHNDLPSQPRESPSRQRRPPSHTDSNYEKNICAYITKKAVQCFIQANYRKKVEKLCLRQGCSYGAAMDYYRKKYTEVFGITLLSLLVSPQCEEEVGMKRVFTVFLRWFLREKYMLYLLKMGKMSEKEKYIEFKNKYLLYVSKAEQAHAC